MNEVPVQQFYALPYDRWEGYEADRKRVLNGLQGVKNVVFLTTDVHATLVNDARFQTLEPGGPQKTAASLEATEGTGGDRLRAKEIDGTVGIPVLRTSSIAFSSSRSRRPGSACSARASTSSATARSSV